MTIVISQLNSRVLSSLNWNAGGLVSRCGAHVGPSLEPQEPKTNTLDLEVF